MFRNDKKAERQLTRNALRRAVEGEEPDLSRLLEAAPQIMAEARRRRMSISPDLFSELAALAGRTIPRLAGATALLLVLCAAAFYADQSRVEPARDFRSLILASEAAQSDDLILKAIAFAENDNG